MVVVTFDCGRFHPPYDALLLLLMLLPLSGIELKARAGATHVFPTSANLLLILHATHQSRGSTWWMMRSVQKSTAACTMHQTSPL